MHLPMGTTGIRYTLPRSRSRSRSLRMCMCMCLCMSMCMSMSIPVSMIWSMSMCMCKCMCICIYMRVYLCICVYICVYVHVCVVYECASADNIIVVFLAFLAAFKVKVLDQIRTINRVQDGNWQMDSDSKFGSLKVGETKGVTFQIIFPEFFDDVFHNWLITYKTSKAKTCFDRRFLTKELLETSFGLIQKISNHGQPKPKLAKSSNLFACGGKCRCVDKM